MRAKIIGLAAIAVVIAGVAGIVSTNGTEAAGPDRVVAGVGVVPGQGLVVHVMVVVPSGQSDRAAVDAALAAQGARPITSAEYSLTGLVHDGAADGATLEDDTVSVVWNDSNMPSFGTSTLSMADLVQQSINPWNGVTPSALEFSAQGGGAECPSLLRECPGRQFRNGENEVAFWPLRSGTTLAVTWYHTGTDEFDIAWNTNLTWVDDGGDDPGNGKFDVVTVGIHEFGHGAGIDHSNVSGAIMEAVYDGGRRDLSVDDKLALNVLYGGAVAPEPTPTPEPGAITDLSVSVPVGPYANRERVPITVSASDGESGVAGISVRVEVTTPSGRTLSGSSTTGSNGEATLNYKVNAGRDGTGTYTVMATGGGLTSGTTTFEVQ